MHRSKTTATLALLALAACSDGSTAPPPQTDFNCEITGGSLSLDAGEGCVLPSTALQNLTIGSASATADYVLVPVNTDQTAGKIQVDVLGSGIIPPSSTPSPIVASTGGPSFSRGAGSAPSLSASAASLQPTANVGFEAKLRRVERRELPERFTAARATLGRQSAASLSRAATAPSFAVGNVGDIVVFNTDANGDPCDAPRDDRAGRIMAISQRAIIVADTANPPNGFTAADFTQFGADFDTLVYPVDTDNFGTPKDIDNNGGRVIVFFTRAVNELTDPNSDSYIGGFFFARDLFPKTGTNNCAGSNEAEMFYMLVPDPTGIVNGNVRSTEFVRRITNGILAHEFQHLINASLKLANPQATNFEITWLNEGLSHIAEELLFYHRSGLSPEQNIDIATLRVSQQRLDAFNGFQVGNFGRLEQYLEDPESNSPYADDDELSTRGAAWELLRYSADLKGGDEKAFWRALVSSTILGTANLQARTGQPIATLVRNWAVAQYTDDSGPAFPTAFTHPSWDFRSIYPAFDNNQHGPMSLKVRPLANGATQTVSLRGGGAAYLRFGVTASQTAQLQVTSQGVALPASVQVAIARVK